MERREEERKEKERKEKERKKEKCHLFIVGDSH